jgi:hypothetical protein
VALVGLAALLLVHEYTGAAWIELGALGSVLPIDPLPYWRRPLDPWLNALVLPLAAFWTFTAAMRWWTSKHATKGGRFALGAPLIGGLVFAALAMSLLLGHRHLPRPWDLSVPAIPWLLATLGAAQLVQRQLATTPTETYAVGESRWTS